MELIKRQHYLDKIAQYMGKNTIIVLTGQRRVGKSCMLKQLLADKQQEADTNTIYIDKERHVFDFIRTHSDLNAYIDDHLMDGKHNYIFIDEVQDIADFERSLRSYYSDPNIDIIVTGSNATMLSSELTTLIGGRYKEIYIQPLSYTEFLTFHQLPDDDGSLAQYINLGGMPGLRRTGLDEALVREYQTDIFNTVLLKDILMRNSIRNPSFLEKLIHFMADNEGKLISATGISKCMKSQGETITPSVIISYQRMFIDAFLMHNVPRFDIRGKRLFESNEKFYFEDNGIRNAIVGGSREGDVEKNIESVIFQHLVRMGYQVYVGQLQAGEIDFVCHYPGGERVYIQASYLIANEDTRNREFGNLKAIHDNYPKYVISMTPLVTRSDDDGITHLHLRRFLTKGLS